MSHKGTLSQSLVVLLVLLGLGGQAGAATVRLVDAIKNDDKQAIRALLKDRSQVRAQEPDGTTPLHWAAYVNDVETAEALVRAGADVNAKNNFGETPLALAAINGNGRLMEALLKAGADSNTANPNGETVLMTAARTGIVDGVRVLLSHGANVNVKEPARGQTALMWAAAEGNAEVAQLLIGAGAEINARSVVGFMPLHFAARDGRIDAARVLIKAGADIKAMTGEYITQCWICGSNINSQRRASSKDPVGPNALFLAAMNSHFELATMLLEAGADPNAMPEGYSVLHRLATVRKGPRDFQRPEMVGSGKMTDLEFVRKLVEHGADVNIVGTGGRIGTVSAAGGTPLIAAAGAKDAEYMRLLAELGAKPDVANRDGVTPLLAAAGVGTSTSAETPGTDAECVEAVRFALKIGNDINAVDKRGNTAMHGAALKEAAPLVKFLAESGAKVEVWNTTNSDGWSPLLIATGIRRANNFHFHDATAAAIREALHGVPPVPATDKWDGTHPGFQ
jgi:ankyrin repeat protein